MKTIRMRICGELETRWEDLFKELQETFVTKTYSNVYMDDNQMFHCINQSRSRLTRVDNENMNCLEFVSLRMSDFFSFDENIDKLDALCLLWIYVARRNYTPFIEYDLEDDEWDRSFEIFESFKSAIRSGEGERNRRFNDVFRNIEGAISRLGYHPYYAVLEKIKQLQSVYRNRLQYSLSMCADDGTLDIGARKRAMRGEFDAFYGFSCYDPNYEVARLIAFERTRDLNVEPFNKIKHYKLRYKQEREAYKKIGEDRLAEYWKPKTKCIQLAYADVIRVEK